MTGKEKQISKSKAWVSYSLALEPELKEAAQRAAFDAGLSFNAWIKQAMRDRLEREAADDN